MNIDIKLFVVGTLLLIIFLTLYFDISPLRYIKLYFSKPIISYYERDYLRKPVYKRRVVISLTTLPRRIYYIAPTIASLLNQSVRAAEIVLNIPYEDRKGRRYAIPKWLKNLKSIKIERIKQDLGPATKLLPSLEREDENTIIIAVDDDIIYHPDTVRTLLDSFEKYKGESAITNFGILLDNKGRIPGPLSIKRLIRFVRPSEEVDLLQGFSGFLVLPKMFPKEVFNLEMGPPEALTVDDIWFSCWLRYNKVPIRSTGITLNHLPLVNMNKNVRVNSLGKIENKNYKRDQKVIDWFKLKLKMG